MAISGASLGSVSGQLKKKKVARRASEKSTNILISLVINAIWSISADRLVGIQYAPQPRLTCELWPPCVDPNESIMDNRQ